MSRKPRIKWGKNHKVVPKLDLIGLQRESYQEFLDIGLRESLDEINELFFYFIEEYFFDKDVQKEFRKRAEFVEISMPKFVCELFREIIADLNPEIHLDFVEANSIRRESNYRCMEKLKEMDFDKEVIDFLHSESHRVGLFIPVIMTSYLYYKLGIDEKHKKKIPRRRTDRFSFGRQIDAFY